ncbi:MAG: trypsin-like serine protease [Proteobacteria bacterium]|nr:MAG: trypsin-like serine protease [Pseudomonadota bacterium]
MNSIKKTISLSLIIASAFVTLACAKSDSAKSIGATDSEAGIIGGENVNSRDSVAARSVVYLNIQKNGITVSGCSATLIGMETVLTAAHCLDGDRPFDSVYVEFSTKSETDLKAHRTVGVMTGYALHPKYNTRPYQTTTNVLKGKKWVNVPTVQMGVAYDHDIAILVFRGGVPSDQKPMKIDTDRNANYAGQKIQVYGYGKSTDWTEQDIRAMELAEAIKAGRAKPDPNTKAVVMNLHRGNFTVRADFDNTADAYYNVGDLSTGTWICQGDSGGPQFITKNGETKVIGVNSTSDGMVVGKLMYKGNMKYIKSCKGPGKAIRVAEFADWIQSARQRLMSDSKTDPRIQR